jgi:hypothetical protein
MHAGEAILVRVTAARDGSPVTDGPVLAEFWAPGRDPEHDPAVRDDPDQQRLCSYDSRTRRWLVQLRTTGWAPGIWTVRGRVYDEGWGWSTFPLEE